MATHARLYQRESGANAVCPHVRKPLDRADWVVCAAQRYRRGCYQMCVGHCRSFGVVVVHISKAMHRHHHEVVVFTNAASIAPSYIVFG